MLMLVRNLGLVNQKSVPVFMTVFLQEYWTKLGKELKNLLILQQQTRLH